ncbi:MAG TPA: 23S rRNA (adenine(2503)-C(2))-methyltransferase RlmN [Chloroflexota bacterium]|nr:23S rRNA (adenine(2503)-C(2))-methyltransferase RlmN [Chloroflexota bacterium]
MPVTLPLAPQPRSAPPSRSLAGLTLPQLRAWSLERGLPAFRATQLHTGIYRRLATSPEELTDLPRALRAELAREIVFSELSVVNTVQDAPGRTTKVLFAMRDGALVESVLMGYVGQDGHRRHTICLSSQVGCALGCTFCATGLQGWARNLSAGEMVEQVLYFARLLRAEGQHVTNIVYMGMGEPLLNYDAVLHSVRVLTEREGFNLGARHLTISTSGVVPGILRFADEGLQVGLAVSLHAPTDELRSQLVPLNRRYPLRALIDACHAYVARTNRRLSFEYTMLAEVNDRPEQARDLAHLVRGLLCHVNLIPWNHVEGLPYRPSSPRTIDAFRDALLDYGLPVTIRDTRGARITAACGQLRTVTMRERRTAAPA